MYVYVTSNVKFHGNSKMNIGQKNKTNKNEYSPAANKELFRYEFKESQFKASEWGYRHQQCLLLFFGLTVAYSMRSCMGVALVAMVDNDYNYSRYTANNSSSGELAVPQVEAADNNTGLLHRLMFTPPYRKFKWDKKEQDIVLSAFFWGYMMLQVPAGQMAHRFGGIRLFAGALMSSCVLSICLPNASYYGGWVSTSILRVMLGLSQACIIPSIHTILGHWAPLAERSRMSAATYAGQALGTVLGLPVTGFIASSFMGWPGIFRFYGILSGLFGCLLWWFGADSPAKHPSISAAEKHYIEEALGQKSADNGKRRRVPWSCIFNSRALWPTVIAHIGQAWGQLMLYGEIPAFMDKVMAINLKANGLLSALPFLVMLFTNFFFSWFTDMLIVKNVLSVTNARKLANSIGSVPPAFGFMALAYAPKNIYLVETILIVICSFKIASHSGFQVNHIDVSPNFAGTMMSISNFVSNLVSSLAPLVAGIILTDVTNEHLWRKVFFITAALYFCTNLVYVMFGTAEKAEWNDISPDDGSETPKTQAILLDNTISSCRVVAK